jgi:hypothetical protein
VQEDASLNFKNLALERLRNFTNTIPLGILKLLGEAEMTYSTNSYEDYRNQGQQDDYFEADLSIAGNRAKQDADYDDYREQGQQNDHFEADLSKAGDRAKQDADYDDYRDQGQQDDYFEADLSS